MMLILFALKTIILSGVFWGYYWFFLRNRSFHLFNRFYLLLVPILSLLLPLIKIPVAWFDQPAQERMATQIWQVASGNLVEVDSQHPDLYKINIHFVANNLVLILYFLVTLLLLFSLARSYFYIIVMRRKYKAIRMEKNVLFFNTREKGTPFSFFNHIFWNEAIDPNNGQGPNILKHELFHVLQRHSADIIYMELLTGLCWMNPFFFIIKKELKAIHEFMADEYAISSSDRFAYAERLVTSAFNHRTGKIGHSFFYNHIKRRITMITKSRIQKSIANRLMVLPVLIVLICAFTLKSATKSSAVTDKEITVVIDAGHGGTDAGARSTNGITEKDLALSIAKKIRQLSADYHVHVVMTREKDELSGNLTDVHQSLMYRAGMPAKSNADLFVSIHINADDSDPSKTGFEMYVPKNNSAFFEKSTRLGSMISNSIKKDYAVSYALRQENRGVYILDHATVPSILIECGFITNNEDLAFISNETNQDVIARDLLTGIQQYGQSNTSH